MYPLPEDRSDVDVSVADAHNNLPIPFAFVEVQISSRRDVSVAAYQ